MVDRNVALIAGIVLLVAACGLAGATAPQPAQQNASDLDTHPDDGQYVVEVNPYGPGDVEMSITLYYTPRSSLERQKAQNNTLEADWFRGEAILDGATQHRNRSPQEFEMVYDGVNYHDNTDKILVYQRVNWPGFMQDTDRVVLGPGFASRLEDGDEFEVQLAFYDWANWSTPDRDFGSAGESGITYTWTIGNDPEPRLVLNRSDYKSHDGDELGPIPFVLPVLALVLLAVAVRIRK